MKLHDPIDTSKPTDEEIGRAVRPLLELLGLAFAASEPASSRRLHQRTDAAALAEIGGTPRLFADACRAGLVRDALRGVNGWNAPREAIVEWLAGRVQRKATRARAKLSVVPESSGVDRDGELLARAASGGRRR